MNMDELSIAKAKLNEGYTLVLLKDENCYTSKLSGIRPLLGFLKEGINLENYYLADKIIGKAQAMLVVKAGISSVYGEVMSYDGQKILEKYHINYQYGQLVEKIINREGNDICPMEKTVMNINDIEDAFNALDLKVQELLSKSQH